MKRYELATIVRKKATLDGSKLIKVVKKRCRLCGKLVEIDSLVGDSTCEGCVNDGRPPFKDEGCW